MVAASGVNAEAAPKVVIGRKILWHLEGCFRCHSGMKATDEKSSDRFALVIPANEIPFSQVVGEVIRINGTRFGFLLTWFLVIKGEGFLFQCGFGRRFQNGFVDFR